MIQSNKDLILAKLGMKEADVNSKYLGLPSTLSKNKSAVFGYLKERVRLRIQGWDSKSISRAGKEILLKMVIQAIPTYTMSVFLLPLKVCQDIESLMNTYRWSTKKRGKRIHRRRWDTMCLHKNKGRMGFKNLNDFNLALLGKQVWRLLTNDKSLVSRLFKARYYPKGSVLEAQIGSNPSYIWRSLVAARDLVKFGSWWRVGSGDQIHVLRQPWLPDTDQPYVTSDHTCLNMLTT